MLCMRVSVCLRTKNFNGVDSLFGDYEIRIVLSTIKYT